MQSSGKFNPLREHKDENGGDQEKHGNQKGNQRNHFAFFVRIFFRFVCESPPSQSPLGTGVYFHAGDLMNWNEFSEMFIRGFVGE